MNNSSHALGNSSAGSPIVYYFSAISFGGLLFNSLIIVTVCYRNVIPGKIPRVFFLNEFIGQWFCCLIRSFAGLSDQITWVPDNIGGTMVCNMFFTRALYLSFAHASYSNIVLMSIERYVSLIHPAKYRKFTTPLNAFLIFLSWATAPARVYARYLEVSRVGNACIQLRIDNTVNGVLTPVWGVFLPVTVIAILNGRVIYMLKTQADKLDTHSSNAILNQNSEMKRKLQRQLTYSVCVLCLAYAISVIPSVIVFFLTPLGIIPFDLRSVPFQSLTYLQTFFFVINPLFFMLQMHSLRREVIALLRCRFHRAEAPRGEEKIVISSHTAPRESAYIATTLTQTD